MMLARYPLMIAAAVVLAACGNLADSQSAAPQVVAMTQVQSQVAGKPVAYLFTAPGCSSCAQEVAALESVSKDYPSVRLVGVDLNSKDSPAQFGGWLRDQGLASGRFLWTIDSYGSLGQRYQVVSLGTTVLVNSSGQVRFVNPGLSQESTFRQQLSQLA
jgi:thiol-disulfide isomerase/thioredoxin